MSSLPLDAIRARAADALAPAADTDPAVHLDVVDAVTPPALLLVWDDPWLEVDGFGPQLFAANFAVLCIASRVEPGPGVTALESLVAYTISRLRADDYSWPAASSQAPRRFDIGGVPYLGARVVYRVPVAIE